MGKYKIGVYAICKNEAKFVDTWVDSMQEADVIVVCDTGSTDNTVELLKKRDVFVYEIHVDPWRFDTPRNIAMDYLPEDVDICVSTDLDEVFEPGWRDKIEAAWRPNATRLQYSYTSNYHADGTPGATYLYEKIHKRHNFRWFKPVHELLEYSGDQPDFYVRDQSIHLMHHPDPTKPRSQYLKLLELSMKEYPDDDRNMHYLGREYMYKQMYSEAIDTLQKHLLMPSATWREERCASMRYIAVCYQRLNQPEDARIWLYRALGEAPNRREPYLAMIRFAHEQRNWSLGYAMTVEALKILDRPYFYLDDPACWNQTIYDLGGLCSYYLGLYEQSYEYTKKALEFVPEDARIRMNLQFAKDRVAEQKKYKEIAKSAEEDMKQSENVTDNNQNERTEIEDQRTDKREEDEQTPPGKTAIVILTYNNLEYTKRCIQSIRTYTDPSEYELILVDNASSDGTRDWILSQTDIKYLLNEKNEGFPRGCNLGASLAEPESDILLLNNDTEVCYHWLTNMKRALYAESMTGAVGAATSYDFPGATDEEGIIDFRSEIIDRVQAFARKNNKSDPYRWQYRNNLIGFCLFIKRKVWNQVGMLDERFTPGTFEDNDYCVRIQEAGYRLIFCGDSYVHHFGSRSFHNTTPEYWQLINKNTRKFFDKWGFRAEEMDAINYQMIRMLEENDRPMSILHYHCGLGNTLIAIRRKYPQTDLYGIDHEMYRKVVGAFATYSSRLELPFEMPLHSMDYILIGEELEYQTDPKEFLKQLKNYLKPDGCVVGLLNNPAFFQKYKQLKDKTWITNLNEVRAYNGINNLGLNQVIPMFEECGYKNTFLFHWFEEPTGEDQKVFEEMCQIGGTQNAYLYKTRQITYKFRVKSIESI